ncbi:Tocopherol cyclase [Raineyella antarctica]|uniref:Tocopherol cyclase n=1 Tax=Raineyella antarctica TaxID=1577474 RepID=A0A1G6HBK0_9ACTN|nr:tocopherol cyclase family protein [Raineyella antarctica]SDB91687.1 Tocopherol cyclase [Raineyella antarctica]
MILDRVVAAYRATGADLPWGDPVRAHGVAMEGYFWRFTDPERSRVVIALIGVNRGPRGPWSTVALAGSDGFLRTAAVRGGLADPVAGASVGSVFAADDRTVRVDLGPGARMDLRLEAVVPWPGRVFGGSSGFQLVPGLNQYWHPWLLGGRATGEVVLGESVWRLDGAQVYAEKNWGREGFPDRWWWGQAHGFAEHDACVAFAGGQVRAGPVATTVTALVVRLPDGRVLRLGNPVSSPVVARVGGGGWLLSGRARGRGWRVDLEAQAPYATAHVLPVPLPSEDRQVPGAVEHLTGTMRVRVSRGDRTVWSGESRLAGLEEGGFELAAREMAGRNADAAATGAGPRGSGVV